MNTACVTKFEVNSEKRYTSSNRKFFYLLQSRQANHLTFRVVNISTRETSSTVTVDTVSVVYHGRCICESVRLVDSEGVHTLYADTILPTGTRVSDMPIEKRQEIMAFIVCDVHFRKNNLQYDNHQRIIEYDVSTPSKPQLKQILN